MDVNKNQLLEILRTRRGEWDALVDAVGEARMTQPGAAGHWSVKDIVAHISAYEQWLVAWLTAAAQNSYPDPSPLDDADIEQRNERIYEITRFTPLLEVLTEAQATFGRLLEAIQALPEVYFADPQSAEWFMKPYWSRIKALPAAILNLSAEHYDEHIPSLKAWIERNSLILC